MSLQVGLIDTDLSKLLIQFKFKLKVRYWNCLKQVTLVDTVSQQGAFQVQPGTHRHSVRDSSISPLRPDGGVVAIAVPAGSLMCYSPNVVHRGGMNF